MDNDLKDYKTVLNYIKCFGISDFEKLFNTYQILFQDLSKECLIQKEIMNNQLLKKLYITNKHLLTYLKENNFQISLFDQNFKKFINEIRDNLYNLDIYNDNIDKLENLKIDTVNLYNNRKKYCFFIDGTSDIINSYKAKGNWKYIKEPIAKSMRKIYTDGQVNFFQKNIFGEGTLSSPYFIFGGFSNYYYVDVLGSSWILEVMNDGQNIKRIIYLNNSFNFENNNLPTNEEIMSLDNPKILTNYYKELILRKSK